MRNLKLMIRGLLGASALMLALPTAASAESASDAAAAFGAREGVLQMSLSPSGRQIAVIISTKGRGAALQIADITKGDLASPILTSTGTPERLSQCNWSSETRLICLITTIADDDKKISYSRLVSVGSDGKVLRLVSARTNDLSLGLMQDGGSIIDWLPDDKSGNVLITRQFVPQSTIGSVIAKDKEGLGVEMIDPAGSLRRIVVQPRRNAIKYLTDGHGTVRLLGIQNASDSGYLGNKIDYLYRLPNKETWQPFTKALVTDGGTTGFTPYAVDRDLNLAYGLDSKDGRDAVFSMSLDGKMTQQLIFARPDVDVAGLIPIGRQNRVVGVSFVTDRRQSTFFDPELQKLRVALGKALPGQPLVTFIDASADENSLLLFAGGDTDPGRYYVYDKPTRKLGPVMPARPQLDGVALATVKPIAFPAADGTAIPGYLTLPPGSNGKNIPAIVMPHGGPGDRDEWGFDWLVQFFANRGYAVLQPNFRGSTGYGEKWFQNNGFKSWRIAIGDVNDAGRWLKAQGIAAPDKLAIVGWSYGGYAALQSAVLDPALFKAIVAIAPVTDLEMLRTEAKDFTNYELVDAFIGHGPHILQGSPARNAARIKAPILIFHGDHDRNVGISESRLMADKVKDAGGKVELIEFKGLDHQLDDDTARTTMLNKADTFLRKSLGM
jgi:dipeptidyl aminopeptidase/acylaminoacyl peptidase